MRTQARNAGGRDGGADAGVGTVVGMTPREHAERVLRRLRRLTGWNRVYALFLAVGIPVGIFHFVAGRIGNGILVTTAVVVGASMLAWDLWSGNPNWWGNPRGDDPTDSGRDDWWN